VEHAPPVGDSQSPASSSGSCIRGRCSLTRDFFDPYAVLGLSPTATPDEIRCAYRNQVRAHHPDTRTRPQSLPSADQQLARILAAYDLLRDPERRARYDRAAKRSPTAPRAPAETMTPNSTVTLSVLGVTLRLGGLTVRRLSD
jgi:curved DNA-binding protein CbpA